MKRRCFAATLLVSVFLAALACGQTDDWQIVKSIPDGTKIHIALKRGHTFGHCWLAGVTDEDLSCYLRTPAPFLVPLPRREFVYRRANIRSISLPHNAPLIGFGIGAMGGAALGATHPKPGLGPGGTAFFTGAILGGVGAFFGMAVDPFLHGKTVYRARADTHPLIQAQPSDSR